MGKFSFIKLFFILIWWGSLCRLQGQVVLNFIVPDSICVGANVFITNTTTGGSTYYWNFCSGNAGSNPFGTNIGNPGNNLNLPVYMTLVKQGSDCFSFVSNQGLPTHITRNYHGNSFRNNPSSSVSLLQTGVIEHYTEAIQIKQENGNWYGFLNNNMSILRLDFGNSLWNTPTTTDIGPFPSISVAHGLAIVKEGTTWLGFFDSDTQNKLYRLNFGTSLTNIPTFEDLGNIAGFSHPCQLALIKENGLNYILICNFDNSSLSRVSFGNSLLNTPTGQNMGNCGAIVSPHGITTLNDCETSIGYYTVYLPVPSAAIGRLTFTGGIAGTITAQSIGNIGGLGRPVSFSEIFRENDSLFSYVVNRDNSTLTRLSFPPCNNASIPSSTLYTPPPYFYNLPGIYHIRLLVNEGQADEASLCKSIVVGLVPIVNLGPDHTICPGTITILDAGGGFSTYLWSTGATTQIIIVSNPGNYWVNATKFGCVASDTISVLYYPVAPMNIGHDTSICEGLSYTFDAGSCPGCSYIWSNLTLGQMNIGTGPLYTTGTAGTYMVTRTDANNCIKRDTATLSLTSLPVITTFPLSKTICSGDSTKIFLTSTIPNTNFIWTATLTSGNITGFSADSGLMINQVLMNNITLPGVVTYHITPKAGNCIGTPADYDVTVLPKDSTKITITASANNVCAGTPVTFTATITNGGTIPTYQWQVNCINAGTNNPAFTYIPTTNDFVKCILISSISVCIANNPTTSDSIMMVVNPNLPVSVSVSASVNPVCEGSSVIFTATPTNGGTTPSYQWKVNGINSGTNSPNFLYSPQAGDSISCIMTSNLLCVSSNPATSNKIIMISSPVPVVTFTRCFDSITTINAKPIKLKGGIPLGGTYSGPGVSANIFNPATAGIGTKTITYTYTNSVLCSASKTKTIIIQVAPSFTCGNNLIDIRDGQSYPTVKIGSQCWMASNFNYGTMISSSTHQRDNCSNEKYCYQDLSANCNVQGANYQWDEIMRYDDTSGLQGLCPPAWHVPTEAEWNTLFANWTNNAFAGSPLKYSGYSGFNALLSGVRHLNVQWDYQNFATFFWSSTSHGSLKAWAHAMNDYDTSVSAYPALRSNAFSVRCIHN